MRLLLVASPAYLDRAGAPQDADALAHHRIIAFRGVMPTDRITVGGVSRTVTPWIVLNDALAALALAVDGHGITLMMSYLARSPIADGAVVEVLPDFASPMLPVHLVWPEARMPTAAVRAFIDTARPKLEALLR